MNQINPLHIGALLVVLLAFLFFTLSGAKKDLLEEKELYAQSEKLAIELNALKDVYADMKKTQVSVERLLSQSFLKPAALVIKKDKISIKISSKSIDARVLDSLMSKILNGSYKIKELKIKKLSPTTASLEMEILW